MSSEEAQLQIILSSGFDDGGTKAMFAVGLGLAALANGAEVHLFLALAAAPLGTPSGCRGMRPRGFSDPLDKYIDEFAELGGHIEVCASCFDEYCHHLPRDTDGRPTLREGVEVKGLGIAAERSVEMRTVTF